MLKLSEHDAQAYTRSMMLDRCSSNAYTHARTHLRKKLLTLLSNGYVEYRAQGGTTKLIEGEKVSAFAPLGQGREVSHA